MGKIIAIVNQKGGVGKTTTAVNLTAALTDLGKRVLLCDFDPQANATSGMGVDKRKIKYSSYDVTINGVDIQSAIVGTEFGDVLPSSADLAGAGVELIGTEDREHQLKGALESVKDSYDCIFVDCPPSLELLTLNALCAADGILVPVQCEYYALEGFLVIRTKFCKNLVERHTHAHRNAKLFFHPAADFLCDMKSVSPESCTVCHVQPGFINSVWFPLICIVSINFLCHSGKSEIQVHPWGKKCYVRAYLFCLP